MSHSESCSQASFNEDFCLTLEMKQAVLISPHFPPSNLAGTQRARLMTARLREFGWEPIVVAVNPRYYEEANDDAALALLPDHLRVERVGAWPAKICRHFGFGDVSLRAQWTLRRKVAELAQRGEADLIFATVLPGYTSLVGAWAKRKFGLPFVLDYQDPWVSDWSASQPRFSKAGMSHWLATKLEPRAVACADALTAVSDETLRTLRQRRLLRSGLPAEIIPIGADANDHAVAARTGRTWIQRTDGEFVVAYLGTITDRMLPSVRALFRAVCAMLSVNPAKKLRIHFIGTSAQPNGQDAHGLEQIAREYGVGVVFRLEPRRIGYLDALRTMADADLLLLLGSTDSHYTASKIFPCWLSGRPVLGLFHEASTVNQLARELGGVSLVTYGDADGPLSRVEEVTQALRSIVADASAAMPPRNEQAFEPYSARGIARAYAALFDRVMAGQNRS